jgi:polar amino acid transport system substrate-binding protein
MDQKCAARQRLRRRVVMHSALLLAGMLLMLYQLHAQTLRVAVSDEDSPPFYFQSGETFDGFSVEVLHAVATQLNVTLQWQRLPWSRLMHHVSSGKADVILVFYKTDVRLQDFYYSSESYLRDPIVLLCAQPCKVAYDGSLQSIQHLPIAVVRGFSYGPLLDSSVFNRATEVASDPLLFKLLLSNRLQLGMASAINARHAPQLQHAEDRVQLLLPPLDYVDIYFAFSKRSAVTADFVYQFDQALRQYKASAAYQQLLQRYQLD